ncbi:MAG: alpha/beta fold hydrolase, partial [Mariprofundaceae bacterium]|nr:alpha/beta fold hydrolase [Mariprofundaceae bacterium]
MTVSEKRSAEEIVRLIVPEDGQISPVCSRSRGVALLLHGLYDSPYIMKDLGALFNSLCFSTRFLLLPAHGTQPGDMVNNNYDAWSDAVTYAVKSLTRDYSGQPVYLIGFSTGGALAIQQAQKPGKRIKGMLLFAPLLELRSSSVAGAGFFGLFSKYVQRQAEIDTFKYESTTVNSVMQANDLAKTVRAGLEEKALEVPVFLAAARNDYTLPTNIAITMFNQGRFGKDSYLVLFSPQGSEGQTLRSCDENDHANILHAKGHSIECNSRFTISQDGQGYHINDFSHMSLTLRPDNPHYGLNGA